MIVREMPQGELLCINQTTHALLAAAFCRHWGNSDFESPTPYEAVMMGIAQHDSGWYEWDQAPRLRPDGRPMDFLHGPVGSEKLALWQDGIDRVAAQHPYAGLLVGQHAALMHAESLSIIPEDERQFTQSFIDDQETQVESMRRQWRDGGPCADALNGSAFEAHTRLLQFGDTASLQVCMPWSRERVFPCCPLDQGGSVASIWMRYDGWDITFDPWPFSVDAFEVSIHGKLLPTRRFADEKAYHAALAVAPFHRLTWTVARSS